LARPPLLWPPPNGGPYGFRWHRNQHIINVSKYHILCTTLCGYSGTSSMECEYTLHEIT
jgi:hypothetical protein